MKMTQVAAQLYSLKGHTDDEAQIAEALHRVRVMGYTAVQVSGLGPISETSLNKILADEGLLCCATHEDAETILTDPEGVVKRLDLLDCKYTAYPYPRGVDLSSEDEVDKWIAHLDHAGKVLREAGKVLCYHNHHIEFRKLGGRTILERIYDKTDPSNLQGELDTYWVQYGGEDPIRWVQNLAGRQPLIHLKDYMIDGENKPQYTDIGAGNLNMPGIISAAEAGGCEWFIVERDPAPGDPFDSLQASFEYLERAIAKD
jgi:sugar phosphate isomerase/epimerase